MFEALFHRAATDLQVFAQTILLTRLLISATTWEMVAGRQIEKSLPYATLDCMKESGFIGGEVPTTG